MFIRLLDGCWDSSSYSSMQPLPLVDDPEIGGDLMGFPVRPPESISDDEGKYSPLLPSVPFMNHNTRKGDPTTP